MTEEEKREEKKAKFFIEELIVYKVDMVKEPSTGDKFLTVRGEDREIIDSALTDEKASNIRDALLSNGDINIASLGRSVPSDDQNIETNRESIEEESEMAKESKLVPKTDETKEEEVSREESKEEIKEETPKELEVKEEVNREESTEEEATGDEPKTTIQVDMSRSEELLGKIVDKFDKFADDAEKRDEATDKTIKEISEDMKKFGDRVEELERSMGVSNELESPEDETSGKAGDEPSEEEKIERGEKKFWDGVL
ncbi:MAG: hypothetical protein KAS32_19670 [Candidatus Peribacteraceae bacterium]|nr:hypothetical protein [Candidatus Peribacteraceae bacterium]